MLNLRNCNTAPARPVASRDEKRACPPLEGGSIEQNCRLETLNILP